jgi:hypothetical protein
MNRLELQAVIDDRMDIIETKLGLTDPDVEVDLLDGIAILVVGVAVLKTLDVKSEKIKEFTETLLDAH